MIAKYKRLNMIVVCMISLAMAIFFILKALEEEIVFFYSPTEILEKDLANDQIIRVGGLVLNNSITYNDNGLQVNFIITDNKSKIDIAYKGILPDLFREGQGVVAEGKIDKEKKLFYAKKVLAKHDENYMPPEVNKIINN